MANVWDVLKQWLSMEDAIDRRVVISHGGKHWYALINDGDGLVADGIGDTQDAAVANAWTEYQAAARLAGVST